jgi:hypothetical protein
MADKKDIKITAGVEVDAAAGKAADQLFAPWESGARKVGSAIKSAIGGAISDVTRVLTVGNAISFGQAIESARKYREEVGRLSATAGPVAQLRTQINAIGSAHLLRASEIVEADRGLGRIVYSAKNAMGAIGGLQDEALATGETLAQKLPLGAALMNGLGVAGSGVADELGRVRGLADALGTSGGLLAAEDRLTAMSGLLTEIGTKTDADRGKLEAMALGLGKGLGAQAGTKASTTILSDLSRDRRGWERMTGMSRGALTNEDGSLNVAASMDALERGQRVLNRIQDRGTRQLVAANMFGGDYQTGNAFLHADIRAMREAAKNARNTGKTAGEAAAFRGSEAGQAIARQIAMENTARTTAEGFLPIADASQSLLAAHPLAGGMALGVGGNLAGQGVGAVLGKMGEVLMGGGRSVATGGGMAEKAMAAGGEKAAASLTAGGIAAKGGLIAAAGLVGYTIGSYLDRKFGISDRLAGTDAGSQKERNRADDALLSGDQADRKRSRQAKAIKIAEALARTQKLREAGADVSGRQDLVENLAGEDSALRKLANARAAGDTINAAGMTGDSIGILKAAIESANLKVTIENHSDAPVVADAQQNSKGMKN